MRNCREHGIVLLAFAALEHGMDPKLLDDPMITAIAQHIHKTPAQVVLALGNSNLEEQDKAQLRMDIVDEQLDTIGKAFLAQTIGCARCHDHKFDPIPTRDYYAMAGILRNTTTVTNANVSGWIELPLPMEPAQEEVYLRHEATITAVQAELKATRDAARALAGNPNWDAALNRVLQQLAWDAATQHPMSGVR